MQLTQRQRGMVMALLTALLAAFPAQAGAADAASTPEYVFEVRVWQVLTNMTDSGLISRALPGMDGWLQIIHQRLDDTELVMDGPTLTWNGKSAPDNPRIIQLAAPRITTMQGESASVAIASDNAVQYMDRKTDGSFELKEHKTGDVGLFLSLNPGKTGTDNVLDCDFSFKYSWVKDREKIDGVNLEVGQPVLGSVAAAGPVKMRLGEWSCYQTSVDSEGWIFVFLRAEKKKRESASQSANKVLPEETNKEIRPVRNRDKDDSASSGNGPKVQVGGSVQVRVGVRK